MSKFCNEYRDEIGDVLISLVSHESDLAKQKGVEILYDLLRDENNTEFEESFVVEDEYLEFSIKSPHDNSIHIGKEAFLLLILFLESSEEIKGTWVNTCLRKHRDRIMELIDEFKRKYESIDKDLYSHKDTAIDALSFL